MSDRTITTFRVPTFDELTPEGRGQIERESRREREYAKQLWEMQGFIVTLLDCGCLHGNKGPTFGISEWCRDHGPFK